MYSCRQILTYSCQLALVIALVLAFVSCGFDITGGWENSAGENLGASGIVVPGGGLAEKIGWLRENARSGGGYIIEISEDEDVTRVREPLRKTN